jgi:hypothetical protein
MFHMLTGADYFKLTALSGFLDLLLLNLIGLPPSVWLGSPNLQDVELQIVDHWKKHPTESESEFRQLAKLQVSNAKITSFKIGQSGYGVVFHRPVSEVMNSAQPLYWHLELTIETTYRYTSSAAVPSVATRESEALVYAYLVNNAWLVTFHRPSDETPFWKWW